MFYSTGDPAFNTTAPTGTFADSGWQWEGQVGGYLGTAIAPNYFITAKHLGVTTNWSFTYENQTYAIAAVTNAPGSDLTVCRVSGTFSNYATLYTGSDEVGQTCVVFGRGTDRGEAVTNLADLKLSGWKWGADNGIQRWGINVLTAAGVTEGNPSLAADFDANVGTNECMLSGGDSGGGLFLQDGGTWKLAGINWAVDPALFSTTPSDTVGFSGAMFDYGGLYYYESSSGWQFATNTAQDIPENFYVTRISQQTDWIVSAFPSRPIGL
ncbi:MAG: hypothetical protein NTY53_12295 [Kiritimatiellaeota bacterium]|nr:hypothetical protein [Kiritimatiellota bacterium]